MIWALFWIVAIFLDGFLIFSSLFMLISIIDIKNEVDEHPQAICSRVNIFWWPEVIVIFFLVIISVAMLNYFELLLFIPLLAFQYNLFRKRDHLLDSTNILERDITSMWQNRSLVKLGIYLIGLFTFLYRFYASLVALRQ